MSNIAFIFPGQGSQVVGMGNSFLEHPIAQQLFQEANDALGFDLKKLCAEGPAEELTLTQNAQPAILTVSVIAYRIFSEKKSLQPSFAAGHSLGEYTALVASGVLSFQEAVKTVHLRGKFMQEAVPVGVGTMAAILGMTEDKLETICEEEANGEVVSPA
ncbi:MAG: [acyl-carrier-protein] S-malonyltransferase, partial [bacterium]